MIQFKLEVQAPVILLTDDRDLIFQVPAQTGILYIWGVGWGGGLQGSHSRPTSLSPISL